MTKKSILTFLCCIFATISFAQTSGFIESRNSFKKGAPIYPHSWTSITAFADTSQSFGAWSYAIVGPDWGELIAGGAYRLQRKQYWEIGTGLGFESGQKNPRYALYVWEEGKKNTFLFNGEHGGSGNWYILYYTYKIKNFGLGVYSETGVCTGGRVEWKPVKSVMLWTGFGYGLDTKLPGGIFALRWVGL